MNATQPRISGPYTQDNLDVFLIHATAPAVADHDYVTIEEALNQRKIVIHETGNVGELAVENLFVDRDIYIQAGEIVRGGRQDRTLGVDFVLPAKGKMPIPSFCVEQGRWHKRGAEDASTFAVSKHYVSSRKSKLASKLHASQSDVWFSVAEDQCKLGQTIGGTVQSSESATSLELSLEHHKVKEKCAAMIHALRDLPETHSDAVGFVFAINGQLNSAEVYNSPVLFRKLWRKLLESAAVEAVAEQSAPTGSAPHGHPSESDIRQFFNESDMAEPEPRRVTDRVTMRVHRRHRSVLLETQDTASKSEWLHRNIIRVTDEPNRNRYRVNRPE